MAIRSHFGPSSLPCVWGAVGNGGGRALRDGAGGGREAPAGLCAHRRLEARGGCHGLRPVESGPRAWGRGPGDRGR
eukprot:541831-Lingulodinium_polyedra.AAC.1